MVCTTSWLCAIAILLVVSVQCQPQRNTPNDENYRKPAPSNDQGSFADIVVESSLTVNKKDERPRNIREVIYYLVPDVSSPRVKRQGYGNPGFGGGFQNPFYGNSQSTAQSDSHSNSFGPQGFGNANALAGAQVFNAAGPAGSFGASATNAHTDTSQFGFGQGFSGSNANSGGQTYQLPNGQTLNIAYNNALSNTNGNRGQSQGSSVSLSG